MEASCRLQLAVWCIVDDHFAASAKYFDGVRRQMPRCSAIFVGNYLKAPVRFTSSTGLVPCRNLTSHT
ncbi:hypothetical protein IE4803_PB00354 (plasmid) [Rhizobium etli bv. phaseoli str. IE4803]|nr:hypothetical protein IE4803_PB00354 [Rhizobium etli bv. phaseoli str. IE4803]ARQ60796.1 hypothetical protein Kim5_PA00328 [Rhizobium sp. Kim5]